MTTKIKKIEEDITLIKEQILEKKPERFSAKDIVRSFFGALFIGVTFVFSGRLFEVLKLMDKFQTILVVISTIIILIAEVYFIGWSRVKITKEPGRNVFEFTFKRVFAAYSVSLVVATFYIYILGYEKILLKHEILKLIVLIAMPCSIGASVSDLLKKY
ncbi:MAG: DUF2391 family protein [Candidatus Woesearchaeota archaeon]